MSACFYVYVGRTSRTNYQTGRTRGIWGWQASVLDRGGARDVARHIRLGDHLVLGFSVDGGPRVKEEDFVEQEVAEVLITRVTRPLYQSAARVWDDKLYPERVDLEVVDVLERVPGSRLGASAMQALRLSGTKQGAPVASGPIALAAFAMTLANGEEDQLDIAGDLDALAFARRRREQRRLRKRKFGSMREVTCDLCGRTLPERLMTAAHIKRRTDASTTERLDLNNIMAACSLGCDALFEHGYIHVDLTGTIQANSSLPEQLLRAIQHLDGRRCTAHSPRSQPFFEAHAQRSMAQRVDTAWPQADWDVAPGLSDKQAKD